MHGNEKSYKNGIANLLNDPRVLSLACLVLILLIMADTLPRFLPIRSRLLIKTVCVEDEN